VTESQALHIFSDLEIRIMRRIFKKNAPFDTFLFHKVKTKVVNNFSINPQMAWSWIVATNDVDKEIKPNIFTSGNVSSHSAVKHYDDLHYLV
jgi:hypothetical protein